MGQGTHALQLLGAVASIVRTLLENHERMGQLRRRASRRATFDDFKARMFPKIEAGAEGRQGARAAPLRRVHGHAGRGALRAPRAAARPGACAEADLELKSSASGKLVIERLLWTLCARPA